MYVDTTQQKIISVANKSIRHSEGNQQPFDYQQLKQSIFTITSRHDVEHIDHLDDFIAAVVYQEQQERPGNDIFPEHLTDAIYAVSIARDYKKFARQLILNRSKNNKQEYPYIDSAGNTVAQLDKKWLFDYIAAVCEPFSGLNVRIIFERVLENLCPDISYEDITREIILEIHTLVGRVPEATYASARVLLDYLVVRVCLFTGVHQHADHTHLNQLYPEIFVAGLKIGVEHELLNPVLLTRFDLAALGKEIVPSRDLQFQYVGLQTLEDRYFLHKNGNRFELPQTFYMRVAMGLAINEDQPTARAIEFYHLLSQFGYMASTPTLFNAGTRRPQLSSCYLTTIPDDLDGIFNSIHDNAMLSKWAGGLGNDWTPVRALNSRIKGTNGHSQGVVPFLNILDATAGAVNQGGKRKGAVCAYLEVWHGDVEEFLELRKNTGDDRRRTPDIDTALWVPDLFMQRVHENGVWTLFSPNETPDLHEVYGSEFRQRYQHYERQAQQKIIAGKEVQAVYLWRKMLTMLFETGHPWLTFKDPCNIRSPQQHVGVVHSSNLCTEITLNTNKDEIAVCNLGSINIARHMHTDASGNIAIDQQSLRSTVRTAVRMLDNVIDINFYAVDKARTSNMRHRPVGLGLMGFQDALNILGYTYDSDAAVEFADFSMESISLYAIEASSDLAGERGAYPSYAGSLWSKDIFPIDSLKMLEEQRGAKYSVFNYGSSLDWSGIRAKVAEQGMRNSNVMAIAPTATIANITGASRSIEPMYSNLHTISTLSGEFVIINPELIGELKKSGIWDADMQELLKEQQGSISSIEKIPAAIRSRFKTAFEIDQQWLVRAAARRQKWIDQSQSLNLYLDTSSGRDLDQLYKSAWRNGVKCTYYLRTLGATQAEMSTSKTINKPLKKNDQDSGICDVCQ